MYTLILILNSCWALFYFSVQHSIVPGYSRLPFLHWFHPLFPLFTELLQCLIFFKFHFPFFKFSLQALKHAFCHWNTSYLLYLSSLFQLDKQIRNRFISLQTLFCMHLLVLEDTNFRFSQTREVYQERSVPALFLTLFTLVFSFDFTCRHVWQ